VHAGPAVLPTAMAAAKGGLEPMVRFTAKAAMYTPGQIRHCHRDSAATAIPVGSQMSVMWAPTEGIRSPSQPEIP